MNQYAANLGETEIVPRRVIDDITVVIPTLGRPILEACLQSIVAGNAWPAHIIVVDQSSSRVIAALVSRLQCLGIQAEHVPSSQHGRAAGVNRGIERVTTRFVAITDDDCFVEPDWLQQMVARLRKTPQHIITGRVEPEGDEPAVAVETSGKPAIIRRPPLKHDFGIGGNLGIAMVVTEQVGLLDEDPSVRAAEDLEYSYRALRSGVNIVYDPEIALRHFGWRDRAARATQYHAYAYSIGGFYGKYLRKGDWFIALRVLLHFQRALRRWLRGIITRNEEAALHGRLHVTELLPGIIAGWRSGKP